MSLEHAPQRADFGGRRIIHEEKVEAVAEDVAGVLLRHVSPEKIKAWIETVEPQTSLFGQRLIEALAANAELAEAAE